MGPDTTPANGAERTAAFTAMFDELSPRVYAYVRRQCDAATAQDVVSETFLVAWRRHADVPVSPLPWLFVVARNMISNSRRGELRQDRLARTVAHLDHVAAAPEDAVIERDLMMSALAELTDLEREALLLIAWDGLTNRDAARVAGCSARAFEVRLSRARARLSQAANPEPNHRFPAPAGDAAPRKAT